MFAAVAITAAVSTVWATQIHRFASEPGTSARTAEQLS
jgi:hypothetical protein